MAARIAEEKINEIRQSVDIVDVISDYMQLKKQGRNYFGLCPFHNENSPSFSVSPDKQIFHCFGCGAGGNVFTFVMDIEGASFTEAIIQVAKKTSVSLDVNELQIQKTSKNPEIDTLIEMHELLKKLYHHTLMNTEEGKNAYNYLINRGFTDQIMKEFEIGYSLNSWDFTTKFLLKRNYSQELIEKAGLSILKEKDGTYFDRFRNRIMFPITNKHGNTIAFSARALEGDDPKYLNSPQTAIFNKSQILYNYYHAKPIMKKQQQVVLFEGFADVIAAKKAGIFNAVATMGTSLTEEHIALLKPNVSTVTICYDGDQAGIEAAFKAGNLIEKQQLTVKVTMLPEQLDPDDFVQKYGPERLYDEIFLTSIPFMSFKMIYYKRNKRLTDENDKLTYINEILNELGRLQNAVEVDVYLRQLSEEFSISLDAMKIQYQKLNKRFAQKQKKEQNSSFIASPLTRQPLQPAYFLAERRLLAYMLKNEEITSKVFGLLGDNGFNIMEHQQLMMYLLAFYDEGNVPEASSFIHFLNDDTLKRLVAELEMMSINEEPSTLEINDYVKQVLNYPKVLKIKEMTLKQKEAEKLGDFKKAAEIGMDIIKFRKTIN